MVDGKHALKAIRYARLRAGDGLTYLRKNYPFLFALAIFVGVTVLVMGFALGYAEVFKASYALLLERIVEWAFSGDKVAAAKVVETAIETEI